MLHVENLVKRTRRPASTPSKPSTLGARPPTAPGASKPDTFLIVGIGASAGGLEAFKELLAALPEKTGMAYVLVPHLDPSHQSVLSEILSRSTRIPIQEIMHGMRVEPDRIFVIPPNRTMGIIGGKFVL